MSEPVVSLNGDQNFNGTSLVGENVIESSPPSIFTWLYFPYEGSQRTLTMTLPSGNISYLLQWENTFAANNFTVNNLARFSNLTVDTTSSLQNGYFQINDMVDQSRRALDWRDDILDPVYFTYYQAPKYPLDWGYTRYAIVFGNSHLGSLELGLNDDSPMAVTADGSIHISDVFLPPNRLLTNEMMTDIIRGYGKLVTPDRFESYVQGSSWEDSLTNPAGTDRVYRRITDILVSIPPSSNAPSNFFAWPAWARYQQEPNPESFLNIDEFWGLPQRYSNTGVIWVFDGTAYLEANDIEIQARINSSITNMGLELFFTTNMPLIKRVPQEAPVRGRSSGGLWLPYPDDLKNNGLLYNLTPLFSGRNVTGNEVGQIPASSSNLPLVNFRIAENTPPSFSSGEKIEFLLRFVNNANSNPPTDMFIARLDIPQGSSNIPENWYKLVRPFSFDIQNVRLQRGGLTILNNVINSDNREETYIRYHLVRPGRVTIQVYTLDGTLVRSIRRNEFRAAGVYTDSWNGTNNGGRPVTRGMYFVRVIGPDIDEIRKIMVVR
jgi:hypothetical protein